MRRDFPARFAFILVLLLSPSFCYGQAWSGVLAPSRAIDWSAAGLPTTFPDGETTGTPWLPPTGRTQCVTSACQTVTNKAGSSTPAQINAAIASASAGTYVLLPAGAYTIDANIKMWANNNVTLRGSGPQSTILNVTGATTEFQFGVCCSGVNFGAMNATSYAPGTTTVTLTGVGSSGANLVAGNVAWIQQCDTGWTGSGLNASYSIPNCTSGAYSDPGGIWVCGRDYPQCSNDNSPGGSHTFQEQNVLITNVVNKGGGSYTVTFTPGLYMPNWSSSNNALMIVQAQSNWSYGMGLEDMTINFSFNTSEKIDVSNTYAWWVKGVRIIGYPGNPNISIGKSARGLFANNYIFGENPSSLGTSASEPLLRSNDSDNLVLNNIITGGMCGWANGQTAGDVIAYNFCRDTQTPYYSNVSLDHAPFSSFLLTEGNQFGQQHDDSTHGTHGLNTYFRNYVSGWDPPYVTLNPWSFAVDNYQRFDNIIGNAVGGAKSTAYQGTSSGVGNEFVIPSSDTLALNSMMRWGNCDVITGGCRFVNTEVPTDLSTWPNSVAFQNPVPGSHNLPCSFFLAGYTSTTCTPHTNGDTGLSWWKVCKSWTTFPTSCSSSGTQPFPAVGPDVTGGPYVNGTAYDIPASVAYTYLPIDTTLQNAFNITGSSWSGGVETLTVSLASINNGTAEHIIGGFQMSGVNSACIPSGVDFSNLYGNNEILMTGSSTTTIKYALSSNPGVNCTGTLLFPDVRQFDEGVYQGDGDPVAPPTGLTAIVN